MTDSVLHIPRHIGKLRIVSAERVALIMAGVNPNVESIQDAQNGNYMLWQEAKVYKEIILQAIKLGEVSPMEVFIFANESWGLPDGAEVSVELDQVGVGLPITNANFLASDIWPWVEKELSDDITATNTPSYDSPLELEPNKSQFSQEILELKNKISTLEKDIDNLKKITPRHLGEFIGGVEKDPLYHAIRIRNVEWAGYVPNENNSRVNQRAIVTELQTSYGFAETTAKAIEKISCPIDRNTSKTA